MEQYPNTNQPLQGNPDAQFQMNMQQPQFQPGYQPQQFPQQYPQQYPQQQFGQPVNPVIIQGMGPQVVFQAQTQPRFDVLRDPVQFQCQFCQQSGLTNVRFEIGDGTWLVILLMCLFTGCCCIPCCVPGCQDAVHTCPNMNCNREVGRCKFRLG